MSAQPQSDRPLLSIGKVLDELHGEFPELTISKIRYLNDEGLVVPVRTPSGYRKFSFEDVERLRFILRMQRDKFWPLSHIRQVLDDMDRGAAPDTELRHTLRVRELQLADDGMPDAEVFDENIGHTRLTRQQLLDAAGIDEETLAAIEDFDLLRPRAGQRYYDADDLLLATLIGQLTALGVEPRHLRGLRAATDREVALLDQVVPPQTRHLPDNSLRLAELASLMVRVHTVLVRVGMRN